jgi:hypothetical protein
MWLNLSRCSIQTKLPLFFAFIPKTLQKFARRGEIKGSHVGKPWRFRVSDLNEWLWRQERAC